MVGIDFTDVQNALGTSLFGQRPVHCGNEALFGSLVPIGSNKPIVVHISLLKHLLVLHLPEETIKSNLKSRLLAILNEAQEALKDFFDQLCL